MDFLERLKEFLESIETTPSVIGVGRYSEDQEYAVAVRVTPSSYSRYIKGNIYPFNFQLLVHHKRNYISYTKIQEINSILENNINSNSIISDNGSFKLISLQCTTTPNWVSESDKGTLYTAIYSAELLIN